MAATTPRLTNSRGTKRQANGSSAKKKKVTWSRKSAQPSKPDNPLSFDNPAPNKPVVEFRNLYHGPPDTSNVHIDLPETLLSTAFRVIRDHQGHTRWREYIAYVTQAAKNGDEDMKKYLDVYNSLPPKEQRRVMPENVCDLSGVEPHVLMGAVCAEIWRSKAQESSMVAAMAHPVVIASIAENAQLPEGHKDRELFMRTTGSLPDKKGVSVVVNNNQAVNAPVVGSTSGFMSMDQDVIEMGKALEAPEDEVPTFFTNVQP